VEEGRMNYDPRFSGMDGMVAYPEGMALGMRGTCGPNMGRLGYSCVWLLDKVDFTFSFSGGGTNDYPIAKYVDSLGWASGGIGAIAHSRPGSWTAGLTVALFVRDTICTPSDPSTWFDSTRETSIASVVTSASTVPFLFETPFTTAPGPMLRAFLRVVAPAGASSGTCSISAFAWGRLG
jgi:hypothetical protein